MMARVGTITVLITLAWGGELQAQAEPGEDADAPTRTIFEGATVIDGTGAAARADMAVVVEGELITAVVPAGELGEELREGAEIVDASDWFAIPGLIEAHTHVATIRPPARGRSSSSTARALRGDHHRARHGGRPCVPSWTCSAPRSSRRSTLPTCISRRSWRDRNSSPIRARSRRPPERRRARSRGCRRLQERPTWRKPWGWREARGRPASRPTRR